MMTTTMRAYPESLTLANRSSRRLYTTPTILVTDVPFHRATFRRSRLLQARSLATIPVTSHRRPDKSIMTTDTVPHLQTMIAADTTSRRSATTAIARAEALVARTRTN